MSKKDGRRGPLPQPLGRVIAPLYRVVVRARNRSFDSGGRVTDVGVSVISVGNISVGGTGKTPMTRWIVRTLLEAGKKPAIAMRGYKARAGGQSDEEKEHAERLPETPIIAAPNRARAIAAFLDEHGRDSIDCVILDDGFQHRFVKRDFDLVLVDATRSPFEDKLLPAGWLREPVESLVRADAVVVTHAEAINAGELTALCAQIRAAHGREAIAITEHVWSAIAVEEEKMSRGWLTDKRVYAVCGVGNPGAFFAQARAAAGEVVGMEALVDHALWTPALVERVVRSAREAGSDVILTTEKDWVKIRCARAGMEVPGKAPVFARAVLDLGFRTGEEQFRSRVLRVGE